MHSLKSCSIKDLNLKETERSPGLPGSESPERKAGLGIEAQEEHGKHALAVLIATAAAADAVHAVAEMETVHREVVDPGPIDGSVLYMQSTHRSSPIWEGQNRKVCVLCNLKPATMRGVKSQAMVLAASNNDHTKGKNVLVIGTTSEVAFLDSVGICAAFSYTYCVPTLKTEDAKKVNRHPQCHLMEALIVYEPDDVLNPKKKIWETVQVDLHTDKELVACYKDVPFTTSAGVCTVSTIYDGSISVQESQVQVQHQPHLLQQQLQHQHSFTNQQQQQAAVSQQQAAASQQQLLDHQQVSSVVSALSQFASSAQAQSPSLQAISVCLYL
ncbi:hypothetical protein F0562_036176 [Nyssa sinensis]|uniref:tRNA-binding domain-containing protein n=1 Tax=Nyssa sinensis TaxID=561372 RepID=A0A5J5AI59_9ASTE|nr:hypothetical protein F0562_036176 [Nyssa sinensis]